MPACQLARHEMMLFLTWGEEQDPNQYAFVIEFEDTADFDYYINKDATHKAYAESIAALMEKATVVDYTAGVF